MNPLTIDYLIKNEKEGSYFSIDFPVPDGVEELTVSYEYPNSRKGKNIVDIGLTDGNGQFLGWSGSAHSSIYVGSYGSSPGYLSVPAVAGVWKILVGAYKIAKQGVTVTYTIRYRKQTPRFLFGDLHIHSTASDGSLTISAIAKLASRKKLDFIGIANHNNFAENLSLPKIPGLTFIPAVEWTHYKGHMNFFGAASPFENSFIANNEAEMKTLVSHAKKAGALISANHPRCPHCPYLWNSDEPFDLMEIWNGPMRPSNLSAVSWWTSLLKQGRRIPAVGGSDFHRPFQSAKIGSPVTAVYSNSPSPADILKALSQGHSFITCSADGPFISLHYGSALMGDETAFVPGLQLSITVSNLKGSKLILVTNEGESMLSYLSRKKKDCITAAVNGPGFAFVKAVSSLSGTEMIKAITNPVYFI